MNRKVEINKIKNFQKYLLIFIFALPEILFCQSIDQLNGSWKVTKIISLIHTGYTKEDEVDQRERAKECNRQKIKIQDGFLILPEQGCDILFDLNCKIDKKFIIIKRKYTDNNESLRNPGYELSEDSTYVRDAFFRLINLKENKFFVFKTQCHLYGDVNDNVKIIYINKNKLILYFGEELFIIVRKPKNK